jgi:hypothetical protein
MEGSSSAIGRALRWLRDLAVIGAFLVGAYFVVHGSVLT